MSFFDKIFPHACGLSFPSCIGLGEDLPFMNEDMQQRFVQFQSKAAHLMTIGNCFTLVEAGLKDLEDEFNQFLEQNSDLIRTSEVPGSLVQEARNAVILQFQRVRDFLDQNESKVSAEKKWIDFGYERSWLEADPEAVHFLGETNAIFSIATLDKSQHLTDTLPILRFFDNQIQVRVVDDLEVNTSHYEPIGVFRGHTVYDEKNMRIMEQNGDHGWNMTQWGFFPKDRFDRLSALAQITPEAQESLLAHAKTYWGQGQELDKNGKERTCVIQVTTSFKPRMGLPNSGLTENLVRTFNHIGMKLIGQDGKVFSTGYEMMHDEDQAVFGSPTSLLATANAKISWPDFDDVRTFDERHVTSIAISKEQFDEIMKFVEDSKRYKGARFNTVVQNCAKFTSEALKLADVDACVIEDAYDYCFKALPSLKSIPLVGKPLDLIASKVSYIATRLISFISFITPNFIARPITYVVSVAVDRVKAVVANLFIYMLGGSKMTERDPHDPRSQEDTLDNERGMISFSRLITSWKDLFDTKLYKRFVSSAKLAEWQKAQPTNIIHTDGKTSRLCILPPEEGVSEEESSA